MTEKNHARGVFPPTRRSAVLLVGSDDPAERTRARRVIETLLNEQVPDRYERSYFQALLGLTVEAAEPAAAEQGSSSEE